MRQYLLSLCSTVVLLGIYTVYSQIVEPLVSREHVNRQGLHTRHREDQPSVGPRISQEMARKYLPDQRWAIDARVKIRAQGLHIFFNERDHENSNTEIRVSPVAIVWAAETADNAAEKPREPLVVLAESATFQFDEPVELSDIRTHMIRQIMLRGQVHISGEDGLKIQGSNFTFSRASQHLFSDHPIQFQMQEHRGYARNIQLNLEMLDGGVYSNNPQILGIRELVVREHLELQLQPEDSGPVLITCEDRFQYHFQQQQAMLLGNVYIKRTDLTGQIDDLSCERLTLQLERKEAAETVGTVDIKGAEPLQNLELVQTPQKFSMKGNSELIIKSLQADGPLVRCRSMAEQMIATGQHMLYDLLQRRLVVTHEEEVEINYQGVELATPRLEVQLDEQNQPQLVRCDGPGLLRYRNTAAPRLPNGTIPILAESHWHDVLLMEPDTADPAGGYVVSLTGPAQLSSPQHQAGLMAKAVRFWITRPAEGLGLTKADKSAAATKPPAIKPAAVKPASVGDGAGEDSMENMVPAGLKMKRAMATGDVAIASPQLDGTYESLELNFTEDQNGILQQLAAQAQASEGGIQLTNAVQGKGPAAHKSRMNIDARELILNVLHDASFKNMHLAHVESKGEMNATGQLPNQEDSLNISGRGAEIFNDGKDQQRFRLLGSGERMAYVQNGPVRIDGIDLYVDRAQNFARVHGSGSLQLPVNSDWEGAPLSQATVLQVSWREQMKFNGKQAHFIGRVRASLGDSVLTCEELIVSIDQMISLQKPDQNLKPQFTEIECRDRVRFEMNHYEAGKLTGVRYLNVASFKANYQSGAINAQGPGWMELWQRRTGKSPLALPEATMSRGPAKAGTKSPLQETPPTDGWDYTRLDFAGRLEGNFHQQQATLHDRINVLHGPVDRPLVSFERDARPAGSLWVQCTLLELLVKKLNPDPARPQSAPWSMEVTAKQNVEIEGDRFRARADLVSYDHENALFVMRALENRHVTLWYYEHPRATPARSSVKMVQLSPNGNFLKLDRTLGASGAF